MMCPSQTLKIIVAEDDKAFSQILKIRLSKFGYEPRFAENAEQALMLIANDTPDVVLTDNSMPGMSGIALIKVLKQLRPGLPAILITADTGRADVAGVAHIFDKTCMDWELLQETIEQITKPSLLK